MNWYRSSYTLSALLVLVFLSAPAQAQISPAEVWPQATAALASGDLTTAQQNFDQTLGARKSLGSRVFLSTPNPRLRSPSTG